jgi:hypothetical protein
LRREYPKIDMAAPSNACFKNDMWNSHCDHEFASAWWMKNPGKYCLDNFVQFKKSKIYQKILKMDKWRKVQRLLHSKKNKIKMIKWY